MAYNDPAPGTLKRKRRRRPDKPAISARLHLDDKLKGDIAHISSDLADDLFPASKGAPEDTILHVAVSQWTPPPATSFTAAQWTILPCKRAGAGSADLPHSSLRIPTTSIGIQSLIQVLPSLAASRGGRPVAQIDIRVADVEPLPLETVYISLDGEALQKHGEGQKKYGGGFKANGRHIGKNPRDKSGQDGSPKPLPARTEQEIIQIVRESFKNLSIVHSGDVVPLPLPAHPVTHLSAPSATITTCEPVSQGSINASTRIVLVIKSGHQEHRARSFPTVNQSVDSLAELDEETSNEAFFTAAEDGLLGSSPPDEDGLDSDTLDSEASDAEDASLSDDSDDMITLSSPGLGSQATGIMSSLTAATPRLGQTNGINTPGSVYSTMTSNTIRGGQGGRSKVFQVQGLLQRISEDLIHPKPAGDDDDEARVYVDTSALVKLGCFSGDWVKLQTSERPSSNALASLGIGMFGDQGQEDGDYRPAKIFGLPENMSTRQAKYPLNSKSGGRRDSISSVQAIATAPALLHLSPILLANMGDPSHIRVSPLNKPFTVANRLVAPKSRITPNSSPPPAKEVTVLRLSTPLSAERALQPSLFAGLREYFEQKQRIVKSGDLLAISIDEALGRAIFEGGPADEDAGNSDLLSHLGVLDAEVSQQKQTTSTGVAWFQIGDVTPASKDDHEANDPSDTDVWGGIVTIDTTRTRMGQSGIGHRKLPSTMDNVWEYYYGIRKPPPSATASKTALAAPPKPYVSQLQRRLRELILASTSPRAIHLGLPPLAILLTSTQRNIGKAYTVSRACSDLGVHCFPIDSYDIVSEGASGGGDVKTEGFLKVRAERALSCGSQYTTVLVRHLEALNSDRMATALKEILADSRILIATTTEVDKIPDSIRALFTHELEMSAPDEAEREGILHSVLSDSTVPLSPSVDLSSVAVKTAALVAGDLIDVVDRAILSRMSRLESLASSASTATGSPITVRDIQLSGGDAATCLVPPDFDKAVDDARKNFADSIGAPKIPNVQWSDVGGLSNVKEAVVETIQLPLSRPELFAKGLKKRSGILFYGPPGTGKTLLAKAIATEFSLNFFSVKGPELLNMYIGESEANVRRVFQRARDARPCCVFFDELDSVAPKRGNQGDSGGVMDRIVSQLLAELDGMSEGGGDESGGGGGGVFVIGATNRPDLLDQALLRPGRFDKMLYLGVSDTHEKQMKILEALTRKYVPPSPVPQLPTASVVGSERELTTP